MRYFRSLAFGVLIVHSVLAVSCATIRTYPEPNSIDQTVIGDWNDLDAAMQAAMSASETAFISRTEESRAVVFEVVSIHDERGRLIATRLGDETEGVEIRVRAEIPGSRAGTPQRLAGAFARRLLELRGVEAAP